MQDALSELQEKLSAMTKERDEAWKEFKALSERAGKTIADKIDQLAACQLDNARLRDAIEAVSYWIQTRKTDIPECVGFECKQGEKRFDALMKALSQPTSTDALDKYVREKVAEALEEVGVQCLMKAGSDRLTDEPELRK